MQIAFDQFKDNIKYIRELEALHAYLVNTLNLPDNFSDLLRAQWVYAVSALDKIIHEFVRIGMLESFAGTRVLTPKFSSFPLSLNTLLNIKSATIPPAEYFFEKEVIEKHKILAFQDPDKISDALSLIWFEDHKWQKISDVMLIPQKDIRTKLKNIVDRRNKIVHEADINPLTSLKADIDPIVTKDTVDFIEKICETIFNLVK